MKLEKVTVQNKQLTFPLSEEKTSERHLKLTLGVGLLFLSRFSAQRHERRSEWTRATNEL